MQLSGQFSLIYVCQRQCPLQLPQSCSKISWAPDPYVQQTDSHPLQVLGHTQPLVPAVWKILLKLLHSNLFAAKASLISAFACCEPDTWRPKGLVEQGPAALQPYLHQLLGHGEARKQGRYGRQSQAHFTA